MRIGSPLCDRSPNIGQLLEFALIYVCSNPWMVVVLANKKKRANEDAALNQANGVDNWLLF